MKKIDVSERIDINKTLAPKECELHHYWFFWDIGFKFEEHFCNKCHNLLTIAHYSKDIAILSTKGATLDVFWWVLVKLKH